MTGTEMKDPPVPVVRTRHRARTLIAGAAVLALATLGAVAFPMAASAATFSVKNTADSGPGSLRQAVLDANINPGPDTITFDPLFLPANSTIVVPTVIDIAESLTIDGSGVSGLSLVPAPGNYNMFAIVGADDLQQYTFNNLILGDATAVAGFSGHAIYSGDAGTTATAAKSITLSTVTARNLVGAEGPALNIYAMANTGGTVTITDSTFSSNQSPSGNGGGALYFRGVTSSISITDSTFTGNSSNGDGGAIFIDGGGGGTPDLSIASSTFSTNAANGPAGITGRGGAIFGTLLTSLTVSDSTLSSNTANTSGGAVAVLGLQAGTATSSVLRSTFTDNVAAFNGGAVQFGSTTGLVAPGGISLANSTFAHNSLTGGSAGGRDVSFTSFRYLAAPGTLEAPINVTESTFDDVDVALNSFAVYLESISGASTLSITHSTLVGGLGVAQLNNTGVTLNHSIFWTPANPDRAVTAVTGAGTMNISWSLSSGVSHAFLVQGTGVHLGVTDPGLNALANNGGPTLTRLPTDTSAAHNSGNPAIVGAPANDQRGAGFSRVVQTIDIGAVEIQTLALAATGITVTPRLPLTGLLLILLGIAGIVFEYRRTRSI